MTIVHKVQAGRGWTVRPVSQPVNINQTPRYAPKIWPVSRTRNPSTTTWLLQEAISNNSRAKSSISRMFVEEFLGLVDLGGQVRAAAAVGVVEQHELTVLLAHLVLVEGPFTGRNRWLV